MSKHRSVTIVHELPPEIDLLAEAPAFHSLDRLAQAARIAMAKHVRKLYKHLPGVVAGDDPHDIHQMRVATRRLRAGLKATAVAFEPTFVQPLQKALRRLARALGAVRDRDVLILRLRADVAQMPPDEQAELQQVIDRIQTEREQVHRDLLDELGRKRTARLLHALTDFLTCPLEAVQADDGDLPLLVRHHAGGAIWREYEGVLRFEGVMPAASSERLHELRIACKHLRYTLELFEPALGKDAQSLIALVTEMQEQLGALHDADVADSYFGISSDQPTLPAAAYKMNGAPATMNLDAYFQHRAQMRSSLQASITPLWDKLSGDQTRRKLAKLIAVL